MMGGTLLIGAALLSGLTATVLLVTNYLRREERYLNAVTPLIGTTAGLLSLALAYLTYQFVTTDYANAYVWNNTANYISIFYRITGVYAGNQGSILLWAALTAVVAFWAVVVRGLERRETRLVQGITMGVVTYFTAMLVLDSPFKPISAAFPEMDQDSSRSTGRDSTLLIDPYMAIHPPIMFIAYALLAIPFAIAVAHFISTVRGENGLFEEWIGSVTRWLRIAWLFLTAAIVLGSLWSYRVLGWGGIWAWDPVEVAVLIPWLFLTATLHAVMNYRSRSTYATLAPAMTGATLALIVYATAIVRSGVFRSVHSFADGGIGAALLVLLAITSILGIGLPLGYWLLREPETASETAADTSQSQQWISRVNLKHLAVLSIGLLGFISVWGLTFPVLNTSVTGVEVEVSGQYYNLWSYPIVLGVLLIPRVLHGLRRRGPSASADLAGNLLAVDRPCGPDRTQRDVDVVERRWQRRAVVPTRRQRERAVDSPASGVRLSDGHQANARVRPRQPESKLPTQASRDHDDPRRLRAVRGDGDLLLSLYGPVVAGRRRRRSRSDDRGSTVHEVPDSNYAVQVSDYRSYQRPEEPNVENMALSSEQIASRGQEIHETRQPVYGTATQINTGPNATVIQLDNSGIWIGAMNASQTELGIERGDQVVGVGTVMWDFLPDMPQSDGVVVTEAANVGPVSNPPAALDQTRVEGTAVGLTVYQNGEQIARGNAGQEQYRQQGGMEVRDVLVDRGLTHDTYVIAAVDDGTVSLTVKQIPLMTVMRLSVGALLLGMLLVLVFDPAHGLARLWPQVTRQQTTAETTSD